MKKLPTTHRIALLFNANKIYDRGIITGIGNYLSSTRASWDLFLEEDFRCRLPGIERWHGDGIIADFDDPAVCEALSGSRLPVVAVGGSYQDEADYPQHIPYVATDNFKLIKLAYDHLIEAGLTRFACFSLPEAPVNRWAQERERAFQRLMQRDGMAAEIYRGVSTSAPAWDTAVEQQIAWLHSLPKPIGIIAVSDARARQLLQACLSAGIAVPEQVALIGIDNDPLARTLTRVPLSSVIQGTEEMGRTAAHLLHQMLHGVQLGGSCILVPPIGINVLASSQHEPLSHPHVMQALHFIRQYACQGIKTEQVADYVGVSRSSLESYFRRELGRSVHDEILRFKLDAAKTILEHETRSIAEIAVSCGFTSVQYMHAVFKRELGCTPREYQERAAQASLQAVKQLQS
ncbi:periplasmic binding s and sugar binding domain of LacI family protein [Collimonas arenae]|uniref:Periplasmic binding s and sugar binding domain of LacI family protein n=1 Tax=Collimonas arenae TaxID=279058 RepID=A0A127PT26_9BURK|nr:DNA-binding transcriptional regulator [Collimonas arenae]AMP00894.1 periplasmic binding s and sugar binding domain of LacI family protein [Collimonas arenae]AMP10784.1 periplasmic binding s and sugar binding domain of LacI family protein [Collimonas arenae]